MTCRGKDFEVIANGLGGCDVSGDYRRVEVGAGEFACESAMIRAVNAIKVEVRQPKQLGWLVWGFVVFRHWVGWA